MYFFDLLSKNSKNESKSITCFTYNDNFFLKLNYCVFLVDYLKRGLIKFFKLIYNQYQNVLYLIDSTNRFCPRNQFWINFILFYQVLFEQFCQEIRFKILKATVGVLILGVLFMIQMTSTMISRVNVSVQWTYGIKTGR